MLHASVNHSGTEFWSPTGRPRLPHPEHRGIPGWFRATSDSRLTAGERLPRGRTRVRVYQRSGPCRFSVAVTLFPSISPFRWAPRGRAKVTAYEHRSAGPELWVTPAPGAVWPDKCPAGKGSRESIIKRSEPVASALCRIRL